MSEPTWVLVNESGDSKTFVDQASLRKKGAFVTATVRYALNPPGTDTRNGKPIREMLMQEEYDINEGSFCLHHVLFIYVDGSTGPPIEMEPSWEIAEGVNLQTLEFLRRQEGSATAARSNSKWWQLWK